MNRSATTIGGTRGVRPIGVLDHGTEAGDHQESEVTERMPPLAGKPGR